MEPPDSGPLPPSPDVPTVYLPGEKRRVWEQAKAEAHARVEARIERIALEMAAGRWLDFHSPKKFADEEGVSVATVKKAAAAAALRLNHGNSWEAIETTRTSTVARLQMLSVKAEAKGEFRAAKECALDAARLAGVAYAPIRHVVVFADANGETTPRSENILKSSIDAAIDAVRRHLLAHPDDWAGARARAHGEALKASVSTLVEQDASEVAQTRAEHGSIEIPDEQDEDPVLDDAPGAPLTEGDDERDDEG